MVFDSGECVFASVTDNWPATRSFEEAQGKFNETGSNSPSVLTDTQQARQERMPGDLGRDSPRPVTPRLVFNAMGA